MANVVVIHQYPVIRWGLVAMLDRADDLHLTGHGEVADLTGRLSAGAVAADVVVAAAELLRDPAARPALTACDTPVLTVTESRHCDRSLLDRDENVFGCVPADVEPDELAAAVRQVARRRCYLPVRVRRSLTADPRHRSWTLDAARLSPRERQALRLIAQGYTHHQVGTRMGVAKTTVETYVERIRDKLSLGNKADLTLAALTLQFVGADDAG